MNYGYIRASLGSIEKANQRDKIEEYATSRKLKVIYTEDTVSSGKPYSHRKIADLVEQTREGDLLIVAELSRLARNTEETLKISRLIIERKASLVILNPKIEFDGSISSEIVLTVLGMASNIERYYIRSRTKISLQRKKEEIARKGYFISKAGKKIRQLGSPKGSKKKVKLEGKIAELHNFINMGVSQSSISKILKVSRQCVASTLKRYPVAKPTPSENKKTTSKE